MRFLIIIILCLGFLPLMAQERPTNTNKSKELPYQQTQIKIRPTVMVFPFFREGENIKEIIEQDENNRIVISKVKEMFDSRGFSTIDFLSKSRNLITNQLINEDTQTDLKTQIIQSSGADISVEVEYQYSETSSGNEVKVILNAYESSTSASMANKVGFSKKFYSTDIGKLANRAIQEIAEDFLNTLQSKFDDIVENGRYMSLEFGLGENSELSMDTEIGSDQTALSDVLEEWVEANTSSYHILGVTDKKVIFDVVRVPRLDKNGNVLTTSKYALQLVNFCKKLTLASSPPQNIKVTRLVKGNTIFITLN